LTARPVHCYDQLQTATVVTAADYDAKLVLTLEIINIKLA